MTLLGDILGQVFLDGSSRASAEKKRGSGIPLQQHPPLYQNPKATAPPQMQQSRAAPSNDHIYATPPMSYGVQVNRSQPPLLPAGADPKIWQWFHSVQQVHPGYLQPHELQQVLSRGPWGLFPLNTTRLVQATFDKQNNGETSFEQFNKIINYLNNWQKNFDDFDANHDGYLTDQELRQALHEFGYALSDNIMSAVLQKYGVRAGTSRHVSFDEFIQCCSNVRTLTDTFQKMANQSTGQISLDYETFLQIVLSA